MIRNLMRCLALLLAGGCATNDLEDPASLEARTLYESARAAWKRGNSELARDRLETLQTQFPFGPYSEQASLDIIYVYYKLEEPDSAAAAAERFLRFNPRHAQVPYVHFMMGVIEQERGRFFLSQYFNLERNARDPQHLARAFRAFRTVVADYPESRYARVARQRLVDLRNLLARHEVGVARFYLDGEAPVAAANRAAMVLEEYQGTPAVVEALDVLLESYRRMGIENLAEDVRRVIRLNFPDHPALQQATNATSAPD